MSADSFVRICKCVARPNKTIKSAHADRLRQEKDKALKHSR